jgi:hypothetical protein
MPDMKFSFQIWIQLRLNWKNMNFIPVLALLLLITDF